MAGYSIKEVNDPSRSSSETKTKTTHLPTDAASRKKVPLWSGLMKYFPDAMVAIAKVSQVGNDQHNPGEPLHWSRGKSDDHEDTLLRHLLDSGTIDTDGHRHSAKMAWRALAILQLEIERSKELPEPHTEGEEPSLGERYQARLDKNKELNKLEWASAFTPYRPRDPQ